MPTPKMTTRQFKAALARHGMKWTGVLGYVEVGYGTSVSVLNAGKHAGYRAWLSYLLKAQEKAAEENEQRLARYESHRKFQQID